MIIRKPTTEHINMPWTSSNKRNFCCIRCRILLTYTNLVTHNGGWHLFLYPKVLSFLLMSVKEARQLLSNAKLKRISLTYWSNAKNINSYIRFSKMFPSFRESHIYEKFHLVHERRDCLMKCLLYEWLF